jgi:hypothetical protein
MGQPTLNMEKPDDTCAICLTAGITRLCPPAKPQMGRRCVGCVCREVDHGREVGQHSQHNFFIFNCFQGEGQEGEGQQLEGGQQEFVEGQQGVQQEFVGRIVSKAGGGG